jgi:hypothetical protein
MFTTSKQIEEAFITLTNDFDVERDWFVKYPNGHHHWKKQHGMTNATSNTWYLQDRILLGKGITEAGFDVLEL